MEPNRFLIETEHSYAVQAGVLRGEEDNPLTLDPDEAVAYGAAVQAGVLGGEDPSTSTQREEGPDRFVIETAVQAGVLGGEDDNPLTLDPDVIEVQAGVGGPDLSNVADAPGPSTSTQREGYQEIMDISRQLNRPEIVDKTFEIFQTVKKGLKSYRIGAIIPACIYVVCRQNGTPETLKEIMMYVDGSRRDVLQAYKRIVTKFQLHLPLLTPGHYMERFCMKLNLTSVIESTAKHIAKTADDLDLIGRSHSVAPAYIAAAAIFMASQASDQKRTAKEIAAALLLQEVTIKKIYRSIHPKAAVLFPEGFNFCTPIEKLPI